MPYQIRCPHTADIPLLAATIDQVARERQYLGALEGPSEEECAQFLSEVQQSNSICLVVRIETAVIGWCDIFRDARPTNTHSGRLGVGIRSDYRGQGIGKALIQAVLAEAPARFTRVSLEVRDDNARAIRLYQHLGFVQEGLARNAWYADGQYHDIIAMGKLFLPGTL